MTALELLDALRAEHYALLGVVNGTRPLDGDGSEPTANSTKRRAVDPTGNGVRIGEASNPGPTPSPTPAAARRPPLAIALPTPPAVKRAASPRDVRGNRKNSGVRNPTYKFSFKNQKRHSFSYDPNKRTGNPSYANDE